MNQDKLMIAKQAELITKLREANKELCTQIDDMRAQLDGRNLAADYYLKLQKYVQTDDDLMEAWKDFLVLLKMKDENAESKLDI